MDHTIIESGPIFILLVRLMQLTSKCGHSQAEGALSLINSRIYPTVTRCKELSPVQALTKLIRNITTQVLHFHPNEKQYLQNFIDQTMIESRMEREQNILNHLLEAFFESQNDAIINHTNIKIPSDILACLTNNKAFFKPFYQRGSKHIIVLIRNLVKEYKDTSRIVDREYIISRNIYVNAIKYLWFLHYKLRIFLQTHTCLSITKIGHTTVISTK